MPLTKSQKKYANRKLKYVAPTEDQKNLVRRIAGYVDPKLWVDPLVMNALKTGALALSQLTEVGAFSPSFIGCGYVCLPSGDIYCLYDKRGKLMFEGDVADLFQYVFGVCPKAQAAACSAVSMQYVAPRYAEQDIQALLSKYRLARRFSRSLDKCSKTAQYERIDQDSTIVKFTVPQDMRCNDNVLHIGSGHSTASSVKALSGYRRIVTIDPRLYPGQRSKPDVFRKDLVEPGWDIFSDVAYGDEEGMLVGESHNLAKQLYELSGDRLVVAKLPLVEGYGEVRGTMVWKPRPHNLEAIFILDSDGKLLDRYCRKWKEKIVAANQQRNEWVFKQALPDVIKPTFHSRSEIRDLLRSDMNPLPGVQHSRYIQKINRNAVLASQSGGNRANSRFLQFCRKCLMPDYRFKKTHFALLPPSVNLKGKTFRELDPIMLDPDLAMRSIFHTAAKRGYEVVFQGEWRIQ